jgi:hypothetical protein
LSPPPPAAPHEITSKGDGSGAVRRTKRDYDYFSELDDLLARLPVGSDAQEQGPLTDG